MKNWITATLVAAGIYGCCHMAPDAFKAYPDKRGNLERIMESTKCIRNLVTLQCADGEHVGRMHGSGFVYKNEDGRAYILTASHVMEDPTDIPEGCAVTGMETYIVDNGEDSDMSDDLPLERVLDLPKSDAYILRADNELPVAEYRLTDEPVQLEEDAHVFGYPIGIFPVYVKGTISNPNVTVRGMNFRALNATMIKGMSGGAYFTEDERGNLYLRGTCTGSLNEYGTSRDISICNKIEEYSEKL